MSYPMNLHYDPVTFCVPNAAHIASCMYALYPESSESEIRTAARALARAEGGAWADCPPAAGFWADSVVISFRLNDADRPF